MATITQYQQMMGVTEEGEAYRLRVNYGLHRAGQLATLFSGPSSPRPFRAFWWRVGYLLSQFENEPGAAPQEAHEGRRVPMQGELSVTVKGADGQPVVLTGERFRAWCKTAMSGDGFVQGGRS